MSKIFRYVTNLDILAPEIQFNVGGQSSVKSVVGAILSLLCTSLVIYVTILQFLDYFDTLSPTIAQDVRVKGEYLPIDLVQHKKIPIVFITMEDGTIIPFEELDQYVAIKFRRNIWYNSEANNSVYIVDDQKMVPCSELINAGKFDPDYYLNLGGFKRSLNNGICFDMEGKNASIAGSYSSSPSTVAYMDIYPCTKDDTSKCKPYEVVRRLWILVAHLEAEIDLSNKAKPISYSVNSDFYFKLNTVTTNYYIRKLLHAEIVDNFGFLFSQRRAAQFVQEEKLLPFTGWRDQNQISCKAEGLDSLTSECLPYMEIITMSSNQYVKISRTYKGLLETVGEIGGLKEIIYLACYYLYYHYHQFVSKRELVRQVFNIGSNSPSRCCRKKNAAQVSSNSFSMPGAQSEHSNGQAGLEGQQAAKVDEAFDRITKAIDVVQLSKDLESLRFIARVLWTKTQLSELPYSFMEAESMNIDIHSLFAKEFGIPNDILKSPTKTKVVRPRILQNNQMNPPLNREGTNSSPLKGPDSSTDANLMNFPVDRSGPAPNSPIAYFRQQYEEFQSALRDLKPSDGIRSIDLHSFPKKQTSKEAFGGGLEDMN